MTRRPGLALLLCLLLPAGALTAQAPGPAAPPAQELPASIARVLRDYERAWLAGDAGALAALFVEDGFVLQPGRLPIRGRAAIREGYAGQGGSPLRLRVLAWAAADSVGYIIGSYGFGDAAKEVGKYTLTLRRGADGVWRIVSDMDNGSVVQR